MLAHGEALLPALEGNLAREDTWQPEPGTGREDGLAMNERLFADPELRRVRSWITGAIEFVVAGALETVESRLRSAGEGDVVRVLDYGAGTGIATIEFLKACRERGIEERLGRTGATLEVHLADLPNPWFAHGFAVLSACAWTRFHSILAPGGGFRPLADLTGGRLMDAVMAANVFHLIPARALGRAAGELASVTAPGGRLTWCSPDLSPAGPDAILFHDPNRALRRRWLELVADEPSGSRGAADVRPQVPPAIAEAAARVRALEPAARREAERRADAHILPEPNDVEDVIAALEPHFAGQVESRPYETLDEELYEMLLVPSIQDEFMADIRDRDLRERVIRELLLGEVLPRTKPRARTAEGVNLQWCLGSYVRSG